MNPISPHDIVRLTGPKTLLDWVNVFGTIRLDGPHGRGHKGPGFVAVCDQELLVGVITNERRGKGISHSIPYPAVQRWQFAYGPPATPTNALMILEWSTNGSPTTFVATTFGGMRPIGGVLFKAGWRFPPHVEMLVDGIPLDVKSMDDSHGVIPAVLRS